MRINASYEQIRDAFEAVKDDPSFDESRSLWEKGRRPVEMIQAMCLRPEILQAFAGFGRCVYPGGLLERRVKELVILEASRANACQFCRDSHIAMIRMLGLGDEPLRVLDDPQSLNQRERLALEYTRAVLADSSKVPDSVFNKLKLLYSGPEIVELTFLIGYITMLNIFNNCLQNAYNGEYESPDAAEVHVMPRSDPTAIRR